MTPLATVCVSGHLVSTPLANVPWLVSLTAPARGLALKIFEIVHWDFELRRERRPPLLRPQDLLDDVG